MIPFRHPFLLVVQLAFMYGIKAEVQKVPVLTIFKTVENLRFDVQGFNANSGAEEYIANTRTGWQILLEKMRTE